ncbi:FAD binding domain-containing isoform 1 [Lecanosticta acicola]|uniref:FAD binding domain-containing isoform 1 n=1 Tax=Lecanosticta acicola TaxID=111012 RepID=A0AAI9EEZ0_9PEZI|nr:FAD binding domain-containing isoform 1 [Lecanosticta acicola]
MEVLIIGAGTTGLLLAQGLKKANIKATVFERDTSDYYQNRERDWGMSLHWGTEAINTVLPPELQARIKEAATDPFWDPPDGGCLTLPQFAGHTGELLNVTPMPRGSLRVRRKGLRKLFSEGIEINYGKRLESIVKSDAGVTAAFEDNSQATGSLLIGCDGNSSRVRELLVGLDKSPKSSLGINMFNFTAQIDPEMSRMIRAKAPICINSYHPRNWMFWVAIQNVLDSADPTTWSFQLMFSWLGSPTKAELATQEARTAFLKSKASEYSDFWRTILDAIREDARFGVDDIAYWEPVDWSSQPLASHVTLAGDAAHAMPPYRGQGLNNALEDSYLLTKLLIEVGTHPSPEALTSLLRQYEREMIPRAKLEMQISTTAARLAHEYENRMENPLIKLGIRRSGDADFGDEPVVDGDANSSAHADGA